VRVSLLIAAAAISSAAVLSGSAAGAPSRARSVATADCSSGYVTASLSWGVKCLRAGEFCTVGNVEYHAYGFTCPASGHLAGYQGPSSGKTGATPTRTAPATVVLGETVRLAPQRRTSGCIRGATPDRRCSPGAYYSRLTRLVICSPSFRTSTIRNVPQSEKFAVEREYGMAARLYGRTIELDHIVSLELGGSNDIANLYPEPGSGVANYHVKDGLENRLHAIVCSGAMTLLAAQRGIATNWEALYRKVFGARPGVS
jgi:hypothetical protein